MRKVLAVAVMAAMLCLTGLVMSGEAQAQRLVDNGNGTVTDTQAGLMQTKDANPLGYFHWWNAGDKCRSFSISGICGRRLPGGDGLVELNSAMTGGHPFSGLVLTSHLWSSMPNQKYPGSTWIRT